tara:strand:- start:1320 stop:1898 length:579 start_codon:yes stop_codon:yes gene_type:complete
VNLRFKKALKSLKSEKGASAIEFAFLAPIFLMMIVAMMELGIMMVIQNSLDAAAREASRLGITGSGTLNAAEREEAIRDRVIEVVQNLSGGIAKPENIVISISAYDELENLAQPEPFEDGNDNDLYDVGEVYTDVNGNGSYDEDQGLSDSFGLSGQAVDYRITYNWDSIVSLMGIAETVTLEGRVAVMNEEF